MEPSDDFTIIKSQDDVYLMLDEILQKRDAEWWDCFYSDREKPVPFFRCIPDENLYSYIQNNIFKKGRIIDIGCGNGRNAVYLAKCGFDVDAIDFSRQSIDWARENSKREHVQVHLFHDSIFSFKPPERPYDYLYDSGCFHHIKPHRRDQYLEIISNLLKPGGYFGLSCFNRKGGADITDYDVYRDGSMHGGMGYSEKKLRSILDDYFEIIEFREMKNVREDDMFGMDILWAVLMKKT